MYGISAALLLGFLGVTATAKITGSYPVLLTTTSGAPRPSGTGTVLSNYPECAVSLHPPRGYSIPLTLCPANLR